MRKEVIEAVLVSDEHGGLSWCVSEPEGGGRGVMDG